MRVLGSGIFRFTSVKDCLEQLFVCCKALTRKESIDAGDGAFANCAPQHVKLCKNSRTHRKHTIRVPGSAGAPGSQPFIAGKNEHAVQPLRSIVVDEELLGYFPSGCCPDVCDLELCGRLWLRWAQPTSLLAQVTTYRLQVPDVLAHNCQRVT
ncbi:unnamed protein product [Ixodes pacificus]